MNRVRHTVLPLVASFIWGTAFVAQSKLGEHLDAYSVNFLRSIIAAVFLLALFLVNDALKKHRQLDAGTYVEPTKESRTAEWKRTILGGICCGTALAVATVLQQAGIVLTGAGKSGFITALYVVLVPVFGIFLRKRVPVHVWVGVLLALSGLYFLCIKAGTDMSLKRGDILLIGCALVFAVQILLVDHWSIGVDEIKLSCMEFLVCAVWTGLATVLFGDLHMKNILAAIWPLLYLAIFSSGIAYTLQIVSQKGGNPTLVSLLMSMEAVFATLSGAVLLHERLSGREYFGCLLMLGAIVLSQLPESVFQFRKTPAPEETEESLP